MNRGKNLDLLLCFGGLIALAGCGGGNKPMPAEFGQLLPVQGKVTVGGRPLTGGTVSFFPLEKDVKTLQPEGIIDEKGNYTVSSYGKKGAPAGKYRVTVDPASDDKQLDRMVGPQYMSWEKSPLTVTVQENAPAGAYDLKIQGSKKR